MGSGGSPKSMSSDSDNDEQLESAVEQLSLRGERMKVRTHPRTYPSLTYNHPLRFSSWGALPLVPTWAAS